MISHEEKLVLHEQLSEAEATELVERYRKNNCVVEKSLSRDFCIVGDPRVVAGIEEAATD
ncbi:hypothetical protein LNP26_00155 [Klebsiella variicola subsp. variicola]|nr:hypothetical protein [Klebsiella variicola subsp. variicola]